MLNDREKAGGVGIIGVIGFRIYGLGFRGLGLSG